MAMRLGGGGGVVDVERAEMRDSEKRWWGVEGEEGERQCLCVGGRFAVEEEVEETHRSKYGCAWHEFEAF